MWEQIRQMRDVSLLPVVYAMHSSVYQILSLEVALVQCQLIDETSLLIFLFEF